MEEVLMDHSMLRRLVLEQKLIDYVYAHSMQHPRQIGIWFDCGKEFGVARMWWAVGWRIAWVRGKQIPAHVSPLPCPLDLDKLPKEGD